MRYFYFASPRKRIFHEETIVSKVLNGSFISIINTKGMSLDDISNTLRVFACREFTFTSAKLGRNDKNAKNRKKERKENET
jgi:hypothetical protein